MNFLCAIWPYLTAPIRSLLTSPGRSKLDFSIKSEIKKGFEKNIFMRPRPDDNLMENPDDKSEVKRMDEYDHHILIEKIMGVIIEIAHRYGIHESDRIHNPSQAEIKKLNDNCLKQYRLKLNPKGAQRPRTPGDKSNRLVARAPGQQLHISGPGGLLKKAKNAGAVVNPAAGKLSGQGGGRRVRRFLKGYRNYEEEIDGTDRLQDNESVDD